MTSAASRRDEAIAGVKNQYRQPTATQRKRDMLAQQRRDRGPVPQANTDADTHQQHAEAVTAADAAASMLNQWRQ